MTGDYVELKAKYEGWKITTTGYNYHAKTKIDGVDVYYESNDLDELRRRIRRRNKVESLKPKFDEIPALVVKQDGDFDDYHRNKGTLKIKKEKIAITSVAGFESEYGEGRRLKVRIKCSKSTKGEENLKHLYKDTKNNQKIIEKVNGLLKEINELHDSMDRFKEEDFKKYLKSKK